MIGDPFEMHENMGEDEASVIRSVGLSIIEPPMKLSREGANLVIEVGMPGIANDEVNLLLRKDSVAITAEKKDISSNVNEGFFKSEKILRYYKLSKPLPLRIIPEKARVILENGVLRIVVPIDADGGDRVKLSTGRRGE
jgi:HSP20 family molecular chaperone IbpA